MTEGVRLREMTEADWPAVAAIWAEGIATGNATFETEPPSWAAFDATRKAGGRFVAEDGGSGRRLGGALARLEPALLRRRGREQRLRRLGRPRSRESARR